MFYAALYLVMGFVVGTWGYFIAQRSVIFSEIGASIIVAIVSGLLWPVALVVIAFKHWES